MRAPGAKGLVAEDLEGRVLQPLRRRAEHRGGAGLEEPPPGVDVAGGGGAEAGSGCPRVTRSSD